MCDALPTKILLEADTGSIWCASGYQPPLKKPPPFFMPSPPLNQQIVQAPLPIYQYFVNSPPPPLKVRFFNESPKY